MESGEFSPKSEKPAEKPKAEAPANLDQSKDQPKKLAGKLRGMATGAALAFLAGIGAPEAAKAGQLVDTAKPQPTEQSGNSAADLQKQDQAWGNLAKDYEKRMYEKIGREIEEEYEKKWGKPKKYDRSSAKPDEKSEPGK